MISLARYLEVDHFAEGESPDPPFICYLLPGSDNFSADGRVSPVSPPVCAAGDFHPGSGSADYRDGE